MALMENIANEKKNTNLQLVIPRKLLNIKIWLDLYSLSLLYCFTASYSS